MAIKTNFGATLHQTIRDNNLTAAEVMAKVPKTPASQLTRWKNGDWGYVEHEKLTQLARACSDDVEEQSNIICAYLYDLTPIAFRPNLTIEVKRAGAKATDELTAPWAADMRRKLDSIGKAYSKDADFMRMFDTLVGWAKRINDPKA